MPSATYHIRSLQALRGLFALFIFLHHLDLFDAGGDCGVSFFIMLSGFVMSASHSRRIETSSTPYHAYLQKRLLRIYPYHLIGFVAALLFMHPFYGRITPWVWLSNLTLLQSWIPLKTFFFSCDSPSWCLSDLFFCYALFPVIMRWMNRHTGRLSVAPTAAGIAAYAVVIQILPEDMWQPLIYINPAFRLLDFTLGIMLWHWIRHSLPPLGESRRNPGTSVKATVAEIAVTAVLTVCIALFPVIPANISMASYWWIPSALAIGVFAFTDSRGGLLARLFQTNALQLFGRLSFAFYMIHVPVIHGFKTLHRHGLLTDIPPAVDVSLIFLVCLLAAWICETAACNITSLLTKNRMHP